MKQLLPQVIILCHLAQDIFVKKGKEQKENLSTMFCETFCYIQNITDGDSFRLLKYERG